MGAERLQKIIARAGITSRRKAEELIVAGRVVVNGAVVSELGAKADPERDEITVDGSPLVSEPLRYYAVHKPRGVLTTVSDPFDRPVVVDLVDEVVDLRLFPVGRLDLDSEGLVLLTNDGALMQAVTRPGGDVGKRYEITVGGSPDPEAIRRLADGIDLDGRPTLPCTIEWLDPEAPARLRVVLHEGRKNQIRRMFRQIGHRVERLVRTAIGPLELGGLAPGDSRQLTAEEVERLRSAAGLDPRCSTSGKAVRDERHGPGR